MNRRISERGISLIEATIVLTVISILAAVAGPNVSRTINTARLSRATTDCQAIRTAILNFTVGFTAFVPARFTSTGVTGGDTIEIVVSDGDIPTLSTVINALGAPHTYWDDIVGMSAAVPDADVQFLEAHLVNNSGLGAAGSYVVTATGWHGAYINAPVDPDPWGNRYAVNAEYLGVVQANDVNDVFCMSAGPDEEVDTRYNETAGGARPGDDDIISVIRRDDSGLTVP